ncbi:MAG: outer membrane beta-barrel protein [Bryobacteraceae bacterium]|nr:outer membrane beta-barrel protein [Bryobacteraceae bacterium]
MTIRIALLFVCAGAAFGQGISVGIKGGVPLTDIIEGQGLGGSIPLVTQTRRYTAGPAFELRLPFRLGIEVNALYKRFEVESGGQTATGSSWEFPVLGKYRFTSGLVRPYLEAGITFNRLSDVLTLETGNRKGFTAGGGLELKVPVLRFSAGLRYSRLEGKLAIPSANQADLLFGIMLP